jgi:membrane protease YdiL (CAAX protease family)
MLAAVYAGLKLRGESWPHFGLVFKKFDFKTALQTFLQSLFVFLLALTGFVLGSIVMANITGIPEQTDLSVYSYLQDNIVMLFLTLTGVYIGSSMGEEIIYRAFLIIRVTELGLFQKGNKWFALIISALFFGLAHYSWGPMGIVQTAFMGLVLGLCYLYLNKRIWVLILAHAYMDTILMVQLYLGSQ